jgi:hypothetical protein
MRKSARAHGALKTLVAALIAAALSTGTGAAMIFSGDGRPSDSGSPPARAAVTPPLLRFAVIGDFGTGSTAQQEVAARMCRWRGAHPFDFVMTTGDNIYPDGAPAYFQSNFFEPYACLFNDGVEFHATLGNHDVVTENGQPELDEPAFGMLGYNYVLRESGVRFVMANSNSIDQEWLESATRTETGDLWTVAVFHHPVYSPGQHGPTPGLRPWINRLFQKRGVDLVLNGHDHVYAATKPLLDIRYVVTGGGGAGLYACHEKWFSAICRSRYHFLHVRVDAASIRVKAVPRRGEPFHTFLTKGRS